MNYKSILSKILLVSSAFFQESIASHANFSKEANVGQFSSSQKQTPSQVAQHTKKVKEFVATLDNPTFYVGMTTTEMQERDIYENAVCLSISQPNVNDVHGLSRDITEQTWAIVAPFKGKFSTVKIDDCTAEFFTTNSNFKITDHSQAVFEMSKTLLKPGGRFVMPFRFGIEMDKSDIKKILTYQETKENVIKYLSFPAYADKLLYSIPGRPLHIVDPVMENKFSVEIQDLKNNFIRAKSIFLIHAQDFKDLELINFYISKIFS